MPIISHFKKSGGSLIVLTFLQIQAVQGADENSIAATGTPKEMPVASSADFAAQQQTLSSMEQRFFEHDFHSDSLQDRMLRLEQMLFGEGKTGGVEQRLLALQDMANKTGDLLAPVKGYGISGPAKDKGGEVSRALAQLEQHYFQHDFRSESIDERLIRLEQMAFGDGKRGSNEARITNLCSTLGGDWLKSSLNSRAKSASQVASKPSVSSTAAGSNHQNTKVTFNSLIDAGIADFKAQRYHHAQDEFEQAIAINQRSAEAYVDLGGALMMLQDRQGASYAFKVCYGLHPFGKLGAYAKERILKLASEEAQSKTDPQDSTIAVQRSITAINRQTLERAQMYQVKAGISADYRLNLANTEILKATMDTQLALADLRARREARNYANRRNGRFYYDGNYRDPYAEREISDLNYIKTDYLRTDGQAQANLALTEGVQKSNTLYETSTSLKEQLLQPVKPGGAKLRALGTNLYARYYGDGTPSTDDPAIVDPPPAGLEASAKRL